MSKKLEKCPFCGSAPMVRIERKPLPTGGKDTLYAVECGSRECGISTRLWYPRSAAVASWNRRAICALKGKVALRGFVEPGSIQECIRMNKLHPVGCATGLYIAATSNNKWTQPVSIVEEGRGR